MTIEVRQWLQQAVASGDADAMLRAGAAALQAGLYAEALATVDGAAHRHPDHPQLWQLLGLLHRSLDDLAPAVDAFEKARALAPGDAMIANGHACVRHEAGLSAADHFAQARTLAPTDRNLLLRQAAALLAEDQPDAAIALLDQELARTPGWLDGHAALSRIRWTQRGREGFDASYERAAAVLPREVKLWRAWLEMLSNDGLHQRALAIVTRARSAAGSDQSFDAIEAIARSELGELDAAGALFSGMRDVRDAGTIVHYLRLLLRSGLVKEAAQLAEQSAPRDPSRRIWPYLSLAWRLLGDSRWEWLEGDPRFIAAYDLADLLPPLDALADRLRALHRATEAPIDQSLRGGTQTEGNLFSRIEPEIRALRQAVVEAVEHYVEQLPEAQDGHPLLIQKRAPIAFAGSWSVRLTGGGRHVNHVHPSGWISSALYIALPGDSERGSGEAGWLTLGAFNDLGLDVPPIQVVEPKPGRLVLFPSTMWHGTHPFDAGERLTVAFDVKRPA